MHSTKTKQIIYILKKKKIEKEMIKQNYGHVVSFKTLFKHLPLGNENSFK